MASVPIPSGADCVWIMEQAGQPTGEDSSAYVAGGLLHCPDVTQEALDAAVAAYDHEAYLREAELKSKTDRINKEASDEILSAAPIYQQLNAAAEAIAAIIDAIEASGIAPNVREDSRIKSAKGVKDMIDAVREKAQAAKALLQ